MRTTVRGRHFAFAVRIDVNGVTERRAYLVSQMSNGEIITKDEIDQVLLEFRQVILDDCEHWDALRIASRHLRTFEDEEDVWKNAQDLMAEDASSPAEMAARWEGAIAVFAPQAPYQL